MRLMPFTLSLLLAFFLACCSDGKKYTGPGGGPAPAGGGTLNVLIFSEYIDPDIVAAFEKARGCKVKLAAYENSQEMEAKLLHGGGASQFDIVVATNHTVDLLIRQGLLQPLDAAKIPNFKNLDDRFVPMGVVDGKTYGAAYQWGTVGLIYNKEKLANFEPSWAMIFDETKQPARFVLSDDMRDQMSAALRHLGFSINSKDPQQVKKAGELVLAAKAKAKGLVGGVEGKNEVAAGNLDLAVTWNGDALRAVGEDKDGKLAFVVPREGSVLWADLMLIPSKAPNVELAHKFIDHILDAKVGAQLSNFNKYATPNKASLPFIEEADLKNPQLYPSKEIMDKVEYLVDLGEARKLYDEVWAKVKAK